MLLYLSLWFLLNAFNISASESSSDSDNETHLIQNTVARMAAQNIQRRDAMIDTALGDAVAGRHLLSPQDEEFVVLSLRTIQRARREKFELERTVRRLEREERAMQRGIDAIKERIIPLVAPGRVGKGKNMGKVPRATLVSTQRVSAQNLTQLIADPADVTGVAAMAFLGTALFAELPSQMPSVVHTPQAAGFADDVALSPRIAVVVQSPSDGSSIQGVGAQSVANETPFSFHN